MADEQFGLLGQVLPQGNSPSMPEGWSHFGSGGLDFGLAQAGSGPGLLGDAGAFDQGQGCADCPAGQPCAQCAGGASADNRDGGRLIKAQFPVPMPGVLPPPVAPVPGGASLGATAGDPSAWWNDDIRNLPGRFADWALSRPREEIEEECEEQLQKDEIYCMIVGATRSKQEEAACRAQAMTRFGECTRFGGVEGIRSPPFRRQ